MQSAVFLRSIYGMFENFPGWRAHIVMRRQRPDFFWILVLAGLIWTIYFRVRPSKPPQDTTQEFELEDSCRCGRAP